MRTVGFLLIGFILLLAGCVSESTSPVQVTQTTDPILRATITGKIIDICTNNAISGAVISVGYDGGVSSTTSDASGSFSFGNVPVSRYEILNGQLVANDIYTVTASLVDYNNGQATTAEEYRDYYYATSRVTYTSTVDSTGVLGLIGSVNFMISKLNTQIEGSVVDQDMQPVGNAVVTLFDNSIVPGAVIRQVSTDGSGNFSFPNVDNGIIVMISAMSSNGSHQGNLANPLSLSCNQASDSLRAHVVAERIQITPSDDVAPFVIATAPMNSADVAAATFQAIYTFSEPIKQTPYTRTDLGIGHGTIVDDLTFSFVGLKKSAADIPFTAQWNGTFTQLTITSTDLVGSAKYTLDFTVAATKLQDNAGNALVNNAALIGDFEVLNFTTNGSSTVPAAPVLTRRLIPGLYTDLDFTGGTVSLSWPADANARSYNVYRKSGAGSFELLAEDVFGLQYDDTAPALVTPYDGVTFFNPLSTAPAQYIVRAVSHDLALGAASNTITVSDAVKPQLINGTQGAAISANLYPYTLHFTEPLTKAQAETITNYTFSNTGGITYTIQRADYLGWNGADYVVRLTVGTSNTPIAGAVLTVGNNIVDLTGNAIDSASNSQIF